MHSHNDSRNHTLMTLWKIPAPGIRHIKRSPFTCSSFFFIRGVLARASCAIALGGLGTLQEHLVPLYVLYNIQMQCALLLCLPLCSLLLEIHAVTSHHAMPCAPGLPTRAKLFQFSNYVQYVVYICMQVHFTNSCDKRENNV